MKRILALAALLALLLCGCGSEEGPQVAALTESALKYSAEKEEFDLYFVLADEEGAETAAEAKVEIRIEDDQGNVLYKGREKLTLEDFAENTKIHKKNHLAARISIPQAELKPGKSPSGTVYFSVKNGFAFHFKDQSCEALNCLPLQEFSFVCNEIPQDVVIRDPFWHSESRYQVQELSWLAEPYMGGMVILTVQGTKLEGPAGTGPDLITYEVVDRKGEKLQGGELYMGRYEKGDSFSAQIMLNGLIPGEEYILHFYGNP